MPQRNDSQILSEVSSYYTQKLEENGATPQGVDWNGADSQNVRFEQLYKVIDNGSIFSVNDLGCGYGALYDFLAVKPNPFSYTGTDISTDMIQAARNAHSNATNARFIVGHRPDALADYGIASGARTAMDRPSVDYLLGSG